MTERFTLWDSVDYLQSDEDIRFYLEACIAEDSGDGVLIRAALSDIARIRNLSALAHEEGISPDALRKALSKKGNPSFSLVLKIAHALGLELHLTHVTPKPCQQPEMSHQPL